MLAGALSACGSDPANRFSGDRRDVARTVERLGDAARSGDTAEICSVLLAQAVKARLGPRCPGKIAPALTGLNDPGLQVISVRVSGAGATATVVAGTGEPRRSGDIILAREGGLWRVTAVGPLPASGP